MKRITPEGTAQLHISNTRNEKMKRLSYIGKVFKFGSVVNYRVDIFFPFFILMSFSIFSHLTIFPPFVCTQGCSEALIGQVDLFIYHFLSPFFLGKNTKQKKTQDVTARLGEATLE